VTLDQPSPFSGEIVLEIQTETGGVPSGDVRVRTAVASSSIPPGTSTVMFPIPDLIVDTSRRYFLVLRLSAPGDVTWAWHNAAADAWTDVYPLGTAVQWSGIAWEALALDDFAFTTSGKGYSRLATNPSIVLDVVGYEVWSLAEEFYGPDLTFDAIAFAANINSYILLFGTPDDLGYVLVPLNFNSGSAGRLFLWGWKLSLA